MLISSKHLKAVGLSVHATEDGHELHGEIVVEIYPKDGNTLSQELQDEIAGLVPDEYVGGVLDTLVTKIMNIQVVDAVSKTERKAWADRKNKNKK